MFPILIDYLLTMWREIKSLFGKKYSNFREGGIGRPSSPARPASITLPTHDSVNHRTNNTEMDSSTHGVESSITQDDPIASQTDLSVRISLSTEQRHSMIPYLTNEVYLTRSNSVSQATSWMLRPASKTDSWWSMRVHALCHQLSPPTLKGLKVFGSSREQAKVVVVVVMVTGRNPNAKILRK